MSKNNYALWQMKKLGHLEFGKLNPEERLRYIIKTGSLASSTHNTQPWGFRIGERGDGIIVFLDRERVLPVSDVIGRQSTISVGCAIGNMYVTAMRMGYDVGYQLYDPPIKSVKPYSAKDKKRYIELAKLSLKSLGGERVAYNNLYESIFTRRVDRRTYDEKKDFPEKYYQLIKRISDDYKLSGGLTLLRRGDPRIFVIAELQQQADGFVANVKRFSRELGEWFIENKSINSLGMPGSTFNLNDEQTKEIIEGLKGVRKMRADLMAGFSRSGKMGIETSAAVGMITIRKQTVKAWLEAGVRLAVVELATESFGGALAVHAGLAEVAMVRSGLQLLGFTREYPVLLFRVGITRKKSIRPPHSPRMNLDQVLV